MTEPGARDKRKAQEQQSSQSCLLVSPNEADVQELEFRLTTLLGLKVVSTGNFDDAEKLLMEQSIDIILLDTKTDVPNPLRLCKVVKSDEARWNTPVVALLAEKDLSGRSKALNYGADDFIMRPFDFSEVHSRVRAQLRVKELYVQLVENERLRVLVEMAGAAAHELAQPLTGAMGLIEVILEKKEKHLDVDRDLQLLHDCLRRAAASIHKIQKIRKYETTSYAGATQIIDIQKASEGE
jgi:two-component system cell cycle response regulator